MSTSQDRRAVMAWALGDLPSFGPDPTKLCPWLAQAVLEHFERAELEQAWLGACELVLIANGLQKARPNPGGLSPKTTTPEQGAGLPGPAADVSRRPLPPVHLERVVELAQRVLGAERVRPSAVPPTTVASRRTR